MIVPVRDFDKSKIITLRNDKEKLDEYIISLIPNIYRHQVSLISNQRFYINYIILNESSLNLELKREISNALMEDVRVVGYLGSFKFLVDVEKLIKQNNLLKIRDKERKGKNE